MIELENVEARLLLQLYTRSVPTTTYPRHLNELSYGHVDLSAGANSLSFMNGEAKAICELPPEFTPADSHPLGALWNKPLCGKTAEGESFEAASAVSTNYNTSYKSGHDLVRATIVASRWILNRGQPQLWAGALLPELPSDVGNLDLRIETDKERSFSRGHSLLKGSQWRYCLLAPNKERRPSATIAILTSPTAPFDHGVFYRELHALSYCVGRPLDCRFLSGFSEDGSITGAAGGDYGFSRLRPNMVASPVPEGDHKSRFIPLFEAIARRLGKNDTQNASLTELQRSPDGDPLHGQIVIHVTAERV